MAMPSYTNYMHRFVILATPRTGSNLLCTLLQSHPDVLCHHEAFNPNGIFVALPLRNSGFSLGSMEEREADPLGFLQRIWNNRLGHRIVGFKMTHIQQTQVFNNICIDPSVCKIVLKREARLKTYVSRLIAEISGIWEDYENLDYDEPPHPVKVDYQHLKQAIHDNDQYYDDLNKIIRGSRIDLCYEKLLDRDTQKKLLEYLRLTDRELKAQSRQQNPFPVRDLITNSKSLARQLGRCTEDRKLLAELYED